LQPATPPVPSLNQVTGVGSTTNNAIEVGGLTVTTPIKNYNPNIPDIGAKQDNDLRGYGDNYISNKTIAYSRISSAAFNEEGAIRIKDNVFQTYIDGAVRSRLRTWKCFHNFSRAHAFPEKVGAKGE
jgi:hypothetical protein